MLKAASILLCALALSSGQTPNCGESLNKIMVCMKPAFDEALGKFPKLPSQQDMEALKEQFVKCFTDNQCKDPTEVIEELAASFSTDFDGDSLPPEMQQIVQRLQSLGVFGVDIDRLQSVLAASAKCGEKIKEQTKPAMAKCISKNVEGMEGFQFPELPYKEVLQAAGIPFVADDISSLDGIIPLLKFVVKIVQTLFEGGVSSSKAMFHPDVCPAGKQEAVAKCVGDMLDAKMPEDIKCANPLSHAKFIMETKVNLCKQREACKEKEDPRCTKLVENVGKGICACAGGILNNNWDQVVSAMAKCVSTEIGEDVEIPAAIKDRLKSLALRSIKQSCAEENKPGQMDPCDPNFHPLEIVQRHMKGGKPPMGGGGGPPMPPRGQGQGPPPLPGNGPPLPR